MVAAVQFNGEISEDELSIDYGRLWQILARFRIKHSGIVVLSFV
jgi:hypothetical protein